MNRKSILEACGLVLLGIALAVGVISAQTTTSENTSVENGVETHTYTTTTDARAYDEQKMKDLRTISAAYGLLLKRVDNADFDFDLEFKDGGTLVIDPTYFVPLRFDEVLGGTAKQKVTSSDRKGKLHLTVSAVALPEALPSITLPAELAIVEHETGNKYPRFVIFDITLKLGKQRVPYKSIAFFAEDGDVQFVDALGVGAIVTSEYQRSRATKSELGTAGPQATGFYVDCNTHNLILPQPITGPIIAVDYTHHQDPGSNSQHGVQSSALGTCTYVDTQKIVNQGCAVTGVDQPAALLPWDYGKLTDLPLYIHDPAVATGEVGTASAGSGSVSTSGYAGLGMESCLAGFCNMTATLANGKLTLSSGTTVWKDTFPYTLSCPANVYSYDCGDGGHGTHNPLPLGDGATIRNTCSSPLAIDTLGEGFHFTGLDQCKMFDLNGDGEKECVAWLDPKFHTMFLTLGDDVTNGRQLLGSFSHQRDKDAEHNGWNALASYDFDGDKQITPLDPIWSHLYLLDASGEYHTLWSQGISAIPLEHAETDRHDANGNLLGLWGHAITADGQKPVVDVWLEVSPGVE